MALALALVLALIVIIFTLTCFLNSQALEVTAKSLIRIEHNDMMQYFTMAISVRWCFILQIGVFIVHYFQRKFNLDVISKTATADCNYDAYKHRNWHANTVCKFVCVLNYRLLLNYLTYCLASLTWTIHFVRLDVHRLSAFLKLNLTMVWMAFKEVKGSVKEPNMSIYFFFPPVTQWCSIPMFCLLVEGECQILVF